MKEEMTKGKGEEGRRGRKKGENGGKEGGAGPSGDGLGTAGANGSKTPTPIFPALTAALSAPSPPPGYLSVSGPSSVLSRGAGGSRLAGPCRGGSPSSGEASTPVGAQGEQGWLGGPLGTETPLWGVCFLRHGMRSEGLPPSVPSRHQAAVPYFHGRRTDGKTSENTAVDSWGPQDWWGGWKLCSMPPHPSALPTLNQDFREEDVPHLAMKRLRLREGSDC